MNRKIVTSVAWVSLFICLYAVLPSPAVFAQVEFRRLRGTTKVTVPDIIPAAGGEIAKYYLAPGDKLEIFVWQNPDLTRSVTVRPDGKFSYPLVGTIDAAGLTVDDLQDTMTEKFLPFVRVPQVIVTVREAAGNKVVILGEVQFPGVYTFSGSINLLDAIAFAGDFGGAAKRESVIVVSDNMTMHPKVRRVNVFRSFRQGFSGEEFIVKPNDVIYVPKTFIGDFNKALNDIQPTINTLSNFFTTGSSAYATAVDAKAWFYHRDVKIIRGD